MPVPAAVVLRISIFMAFMWVGAGRKVCRVVDLIRIADVESPAPPLK